MSPLSRFVLPVLAAASSAYAASCSVSATATIQNGGDATALASCKTFTGSIAIETGVAEDISLDGIQKIDGNLVCKNNSQILGIGADSLEEIAGEFRLEEVQRLNRVTFPKLKTVEALRWIALPVLRSLSFDAQITKAATIQIENTQLQDLTGINLESVDNVNIVNNPYITEINMQLGNVTQELIIGSNNPDVKVSFPNMLWAFNVTFRNCSSLELPSLASLNKSMTLYGNVFESFAVPNLTEVGGAISLVSNTELSNLSMPLLETIEDNLQISNNTKLSKINGFPLLKSIGASLDFNGNMSEVSLPSLNNVVGAFNIQSTGDIQKTCDETFEPMSKSRKIQGKYFCVGSVQDPGGAGTTPTQTGANAKKTNGASALNVQNGALGLAGMAAAFFL